MDVSFEERYKLWDNFLKTWPVKRVRDMTLEDYTNLNRQDSFTYWVEAKTQKLGSIWGGSAFKFGIYRRESKEKKENSRGFCYSDKYAWYEKYGKTEEEAFETVKTNILQVIESIQHGFTPIIDKIDLWPVFKWKIAFLYQDKRKPQVVSILSPYVLESLLQLPSNSSVADMHAQLLINKRDLKQGILEYGHQLWQDYKSMLRIWKVSHGKEVYSPKERSDYLEEHIISVHQDTGRNGGKNFVNGMKVGDLFYLCHGNDEGLVLIGEVTSDPFPMGEEGWQGRNYKVLRKLDAPVRYKGPQKGWAPNYLSTCVQVNTNELKMFEKELLIKYFDLTLDDLVNLMEDGEITSTPNKPKIYKEFSPNREAVTPCLNAERYARALTRMFLSANGEFSFALFGKWGRGKTFLMKLVSEELEANHGYEVVNFRAWKYRTNPSIWIHLYETFVDKINKKSLLEKFIIYLRIGIVKHGSWPLIGILATFFSLLLPLSDVAYIAWGLRAFLGLAGCLGIYIIVKGIWKVGPEYKKRYGSVPNFKEKLGLQETVGTSLKYLIQGWTFKGIWTWKNTVQLILINSLICVIAYRCIVLLTHCKLEVKSLLNFIWTWKYLILLGIIITVAGIVIAGKFRKQKNEEDNNTDTNVTPKLLERIKKKLSLKYKSDSAISSEPKGTTGFWNKVCTPFKACDKVLLVVDDLDRCEMSEMLTIIESIILLLDEDDLKDKMQIAMLVEDEAVRLAISKKYIEMIRSRCFSTLGEELKKPDAKTPEETNHLNCELYSKLNSEVVNENIEKLFLSTLKLEKLSSEEKLEAMKNFLDEDIEEENEESPESITPLDPDHHIKLGSVSPITPNPDYPEDEDFPGPSKPTKTIFTIQERDAVVGIIENWGKDSVDKWGPRALRALKFKYLFARLLLVELGVEVNPEYLALCLKACLKKYYDIDYTIQDALSDVTDQDKEMYERVVEQVI